MITSLTSPKIAKVRRLLETHSPRERSALGQFAVEGLRTLEEVMASSAVTLIELFATSKWLERFPQATEISDEVAKRISDTVSTQGVLGVFTLPEPQLDLTTAKRAKTMVLFSEIQDPGNAGTVIRNAHAFGLDLVVFTKGSVDPFSSKVVRSSTGSIASQPILTDVDGEEFLMSLSASHLIVAFDMSGEAMNEVEMVKPLILIFGNEARGLPDAIRENPKIQKVSIPMPGDAESLNVASAATVAMYEISRRSF